MSLAIKNLSYIYADGMMLYNQLSLTVNDRDKIAIVGNNGTGKSTLLKQIVGQLEASKGSVILDDDYFYLPQDFSPYKDQRLDQVLGLYEKRLALNRILAGDASAENFEILNDDWDLEERIHVVLSKWGIAYLVLERMFDTLSGGEQMKLLLAGIEISQAKFVVLDEPTNHLDFSTRALFYQWVERTKCTLLLTSHDRELLNLMSGIYELNSLGIKFYNGNYDNYEEIKRADLEALSGKLKGLQQEKKTEIKKQQLVAERRHKIESRGYAQSVDKGITKLGIDYRQNRAENVSSRIKEVFQSRVEDIGTKIESVKSQVAREQVLKMHLDSPSTIKGKELVRVEGLNFSYNRSDLIWANPLSFVIRQGDRVLIRGGNGSGKSTLLSLLLGRLSANIGSICNQSTSVFYLNQQYDSIENELTVLELADKHNDTALQEDEIRCLLSRSQFDESYWNHPCSTLSGGEKMKLAFCCLQIAAICPDLIILDEPTNNIDLKSIQILTETIAEYKGTLIVVSHDARFIKEISMNQYIDLYK